MSYATTLQLASILGLKKSIPSWDVESSPVLETVGTGDDSNTLFYLDHQYVIDNTYTLYYGASASSVTALTETTHYTIDLTKGKITLTSAGVTLVSTDNVYGEYDYYSVSVADSYFSDVLDRAKVEVDNVLNTTFTDGTTSNPGYPSKTEYQSSKGSYDRSYFSGERPLIDVSSSLSGDITSTDTSLSVASGDGASFPSSGTIVVGSEKITYSGVSTDTLTGLTRGVGDSTAAAHSEDDEIHTTVVEVSGTDEGTTPTWNVLSHGSEVVVTGDLGKVFIYRNTVINSTYINDTVMSKEDVDNRFKLTYLYGWNSVPYDIIRLNLLLAKRMLITDNYGGSLVKGRDEFNPEMFNSDESEINKIISAYRELPMGNV